MTTTLASLRTTLRRTIRDAVAASYTFTDDEIADMIGEGIDVLDSLYPKEIVASISLTTAVYTYSLTSTVDRIYRIDVMDSDGSVYDDDFDESQSQGIAGGWVLHGGTLYLPQRTDLKTGMTLRVWGYGPWAQIDSSSASSATTDLDQRALIAIRKYVAYAATQRLSYDRVKFQQIQQSPENTDVGPIAILQYQSAARNAWEAEQTRLTAMRKAG